MLNPNTPTHYRIVLIELVNKRYLPLNPLYFHDCHQIISFSTKELLNDYPSLFSDQFFK